MMIKLCIYDSGSNYKNYCEKENDRYMIGNADERYNNVVDDDDDKIVMMMIK
jgi:hypothetical protein